MDSQQSRNRSEPKTLAGREMPEGQRQLVNFNRLALFMVVAFVLTAGFYVLLFFLIEVWQMLVPAGGMVLSLGIVFMASRLARRGSLDAAGRWVLFALALACGSGELAWDGVTLYLALAGGLLIVLVGGQLLPRKWGSWVGMTALYGAGIFLINYFEPLPRFEVARSTLLSFYIPGIAAVSVLFSLWQLIHTLVAGSIRTKLIVSSLIFALLPLVVVGVLVYMQVQDNLQAQVGQSIESVAVASGAEAERLLADRYGDIRVMAGSPVLTSAESTPEEKAAYLHLIRDSYGVYRALHLVDSEGHMVAATDGSLSNQADQEWFKRAILGQVYVSKVRYLPAVAEIVITFASPVRDEEGEVIGAVAAHFDLDELIEEIKVVSVGEMGTLMLVDGEGRLVVASDKARIFEDLSTFSPVQAALLEESGHGVFPTYRLPGEFALYGYTPLRGIKENWVAIAELPLGEVNKVFGEFITRLVFVFGGVVVVVGVAVLLLVGSLVRPIRDLMVAADAISAGELSHRARVTTRDEIGELGHSFNSMAAQLEGLVEGLEERVVDRTRELETSAQVLASRSEELENALVELQEREGELEEAVRLQEEARRRQEAINRELEEANHAIRRRSAQLQATAEISRAIAQVRELDELLPLVTQLIGQHFGFYHVGIFLVDEARRNAVLRAANSEGGQRMLARGHRLPVGEQGIVGYVSGTGRPRIALDVGVDAVYFDNPDLSETRSEMALPLRWGGEVVGALDVQSNKPGAFDSQDMAVLQTLADQVSVALENARLFTQTQEALAEAEAERQQRLLQEWQRYAQQATDLSHEYMLSGQEGLAGRPLPAGDAALTKGSTVVLPAGSVEEGTAVAVPIKLRDQVIGVLDLQEMVQDRHWTEEEVALVEAVAEQLARTLEAVRLSEQTQARAHREALTREITDRIRDAMDVDSMLQTAIRELGRALNAPRVYVRLGIETRDEGEMATVTVPTGSNGPDAGGGGE